jgi:hypothetical protein
VGCPLPKSPTAAAAAATKSIDGSSLNPVETADPTESGISPSLLSTEKHALLFSGSGVVPESGRSAAAGPNHGSPQLRSWELGLEHLAVAPDAKANRGPHNPIFHPRSQGENPAAVVPRPHLDLAQQTPLGIVTGPLYLASPFKDGTTSSALTQSGVNVTAQSVKSRGPHTSPSPDPLHTRYLHLNLVSKALAPAYTTEYGHPQAQRGLVGHAVAEESAAAAAVRTNVIDLSVPDLVTAQFGPSSAPLPSMYGLLFDTDRDSVDGLRADERSRSSSRLLLGSDRMMMSPHVTVTVPVNPTPVSFLAKWEDMLALERQIRSSSCGAKLVQAKKAQAVEAHRTRLQGSRGEVTLTGTGTGKVVYCTSPSNYYLFHYADTWPKQTAFLVV